MVQEIITWAQVEHICLDVSPKLKKPDAIIAIGRGGFVPAAILSNRLDVRMVVNYGTQSYFDKEQASIRVTQRPDLSFLTEYKDRNILIVDDISDKGHTLKHIVNYFKQYGFNNLETFTLFSKTGTAYIPNWYSKEYAKDVWLVFPWESK
jgi:hypoxanthine phosphoribosyltransferase